jgi:sorbitol-specific phosphotransferase system component IIC
VIELAALYYLCFLLHSQLLDCLSSVSVHILPLLICLVLSLSVCLSDFFDLRSTLPSCHFPAHCTTLACTSCLWCLDLHVFCFRYANLFLKAVSEKEAPGYYDVVRRPTDLATIKAKLESGVSRGKIEECLDLYV